nr:hypothetical protein [uncultured Ruegeria sp.]
MQNKKARDPVQKVSKFLAEETAPFAVFGGAVLLVSNVSKGGFEKLDAHYDKLPTHYEIILGIWGLMVVGAMLIAARYYLAHAVTSFGRVYDFFEEFDSIEGSYWSSISAFGKASCYSATVHAITVMVLLNIFYG